MDNKTPIKASWIYNSIIQRKEN